MGEVPLWGVGSVGCHHAGPAAVQVFAGWRLQRHLVHERHPPLKDHHRSLDIGIL